MHQNYYFLKQLAPRLHRALSGKIFVEAFSQEKDELILVFANAVSDDALESPFFIKASLTSQFACLSFPDRFDRARKNSVNLFTDFQGVELNSVSVFKNERALNFDFADGKKLIFKLFGNRSNLISYDAEDSVLQLFNNKLEADKNITLNALNREIDQSYETYLENELRHEALFPTFGKLINARLKELLVDITSPEERWETIQEMLRQLNASEFFVTVVDSTPVLSLFKTGEVLEHFSDPIEALNHFYIAYIRLNGLEKEKGDWIRILKKRITQTDNYLDNTFKKLVELESAVKNEEVANILMANMHQIPDRAEKVELYDFYRDQPIIIKLKKDLSPQINAEGYYRKSKNEKIEFARLNESLEVREAEREKLKEHLTNIEPMESLRELRAYVKSQGLDQGKAVVTVDDLFKKVEFQGYTILIGRNAKNNDLLTKKYASKEDLWLHAKDVTGSHVVVKNQAGRRFPSTVIERAAELAAFYSKRKNDSLCPVIFTPKKFVRKPKGLPDGAVTVDKEDVVMVVAKGE